MFRLLTILAVFFLSFSAQAAESTPKLDIGKGGQCVEDPQFMRKNHMHLLHY